MIHLLLIEDNDDIRENTAEILQLAGYRVTTAANGKLGVQAAMDDKPNLIICDVMMPVLDGHGVLQLLQKNKELAGIPFIFLTAKADRSDFRKGMEMGADDYITKPFTDSELLSAIEIRLNKLNTIKEQYHASQVNAILTDFSNKTPIQFLAESGTINHYKKKQQIFTEGNNPVRLFFIEKGKVKTYKVNEEGKELTIGLYNEGDFFGYTALLEDSVYNESAQAMEDAEISVIAKEDFEKLMHCSPQIQTKFIQLLAKNVAEKEIQLLNIAYNSLRKRVANALLTLSNKYKKENEEIFSIHISREDLANIAGTATESLIRTLSDFKGEKLIKIKDGLISIINEQKLKSLVN
ncbi:MAG: response regulator [Ferruginibacter sp.]|nr:response regulator [Ferruginibacter sp.]